MPNAAAAATVLRGNLHRENFTSWQEAVLVAEVQERRRADGHHDNVRTLGAVMGWSHGKVNMLLRIRRALPPAVLARAGEGDRGGWRRPSPGRPYRDLERLAAEGDDARRADAVRRLLGLGPVDAAPGAEPRDRPPCTHRPKRGGGFVVEVHEPVEALTAGDAALVYEVLSAQLARVRTRLAQLGHPLGDDMGAANGSAAGPREAGGGARRRAGRSASAVTAAPDA
jgi:ParB family chromosome partitioning protein